MVQLVVEGTVDISRPKKTRQNSVFLNMLVVDDQDEQDRVKWKDYRMVNLQSTHNFVFSGRLKKSLLH